MNVHFDYNADCCDGSDEYEREINCVLSCPKDNDDDQGAGKKSVKEMVPILLQSDKLKLGSSKPERKSLKNAVHKLRGQLTWSMIR